MKNHPLRNWRASHGKSLDELAATIGISKASLSRIETFEQSPSLGVIISIVWATKGEVNADDFLPEPERRLVEKQKARR